MEIVLLPEDSDRNRPDVVEADDRRIRVDFLEPDRFVIQITSPFMMPRETLLENSRSPDAFCTSRIETIGRPKFQPWFHRDLAFRVKGPAGNGKAIDENGQ